MRRVTLRATSSLLRPLCSSYREVPDPILVFFCLPAAECETLSLHAAQESFTFSFKLMIRHLQRFTVSVASTL